MSQDEQDIRQLVVTWAQATQQGDVSTVLNLMSEDVVFLAAGQPPMNRSMFEAAMQEQTSSQTARPQFESTNDIKEITILGDWAYMWSWLKVIVTPSNGSPSITRTGHTLTILHKQAGKWVIARDANMLTLAKPASN